MNDTDFYRALQETQLSIGDKRKEVDELRHKMDKLKFKWQKYQYYQAISGAQD